jgi:hypothetical protein
MFDNFRFAADDDLDDFGPEPVSMDQKTKTRTS